MICQVWGYLPSALVLKGLHLDKNIGKKKTVFAFITCLSIYLWIDPSTDIKKRCLSYNLKWLITNKHLLSFNTQGTMNLLENCISKNSPAPRLKSYLSCQLKILMKQLLKLAIRATLKYFISEIAVNVECLIKILRWSLVLF